MKPCWKLCVELITHQKNPKMFVNSKCISKFLYLNFVGKPTREKVIEQIKYALKQLKNNRQSKIVVDTRDLNIILPLSLNWYRHTWCPKAVKSGLKYVALVVPENFLPQKALKRLNGLSSNNSGIITRFFSSTDEAEEWLDGTDTWPIYTLN